MTKPKYRFLHRANGVYYWENTRKVDSRVEQIYCGVDWFWGGKNHFWIEQIPRAETSHRNRPRVGMGSYP